MLNDCIQQFHCGGGLSNSLIVTSHFQCTAFTLQYNIYTLKHACKISEFQGKYISLDKFATVPTHIQEVRRLEVLTVNCVSQYYVERSVLYALTILSSAKLLVVRSLDRLLQRRFELTGDGKYCYPFPKLNSVLKYIAAILLTSWLRYIN
jgi:hypothetical protein